MAAMVLSVVFVMAACYTSLTASFTDGLEKEAKAIADKIDGKDINQMLDSLSYDISDKRITVIDKEGTVLFDNVKDISSSENHLDRPEIADAKKNGYGTSSRRSSTLGMNQLYYAMKLPDGTFLRIGSDFDGMNSMFFTILIAVLFVTALLYLLTIIVA